MIRIGKKTISAKHLIAVFLFLSIVVGIFSAAIISTVDAATVAQTTEGAPSYETVAKAVANNRVIFVCGYDDELLTKYKHADCNGNLGSNPEVSLNWGNARRFHTLSEAFWYIHSGGLGIDATSDEVKSVNEGGLGLQATYRADDWVILVRGIQQFKHSSNSEIAPTADQVRRGINLCYKNTDGTLSYGIHGRHSFAESNVNSSTDRTSTISRAADASGAGAWDHWGRDGNGDYTKSDFKFTTSYKAGTTYQHTGTWYITGVHTVGSTSYNYLEETTANGKTVGSKIYFNISTSLYFSTGGPVHFSNIELISNRNVHFYGEEGFTVGDNVKTPVYTYTSGDTGGSSNNRYLFSVYAGPAHGTALVANCSIILTSGNWRTIMAGSNQGDITGNVTIYVKGNSTKVYSNITAGYNKTVSGNVNIYIDNYFVPYIYPSPRSGGVVTGTTNIHLMSNSTVMSIEDLNLTTATTMGPININIYDGAHLMKCTSKWADTNLNSNGGATATLYLNGVQGGFSDNVSLAGFDKITLTNGAKVSYRKTFQSGSALTVNSGCMLYLSNYSDSSKLPSMSITGGSNIRYVLVYYVDQASKPSSITYKYLDDFKATEVEGGTLTLGITGYTEKTAFQSLSAAYNAANSSAVIVPCQFIISGNTTENSLMGAVYSELSDNHITISAINNAVLTLGSGVNFGYVTTLENITINATEFYSGKHLTVDTGTVFSNGASTQIYAGLSDRDCTTAGDITLNTGSVSAVYLGNDAYSVADYTLNINGGAYAGIVYCGASKNTGNLTVNINGTAAGNGAYNVGWITTTPYNPNGVVTGNVTVNFTRGAMSNDIKLYGDYYTSNGTQVDTRANSGTVSGDIVVNLSDEFVYEYNSMFYNKPHISDTKYGIITLNLSGWTRQITAKDVGLMSNIDTLGAVSETYNGTTTATNAICYESLASTQLISNVNDTSQYAAKISAAADNTVYFHHPDYDTYTATTNSTGVLYFGHQFPVDANSTYVKSAQYATKTTHGWVEYGQCSLCGKYFASSDDGTVKYTARANADSASASTACTLESCYRYWYDVYLYSVGIDGGGGGIYEFVAKSGVEYEDNCCGADERLLNGQQIKANAYDYYTFAYWYWDGTSVQASNSTTFTLNIDQVKQHSNANRQSDLVAVFSRKLGNMQIVRNGATDATQVFVFKITYDTSKMGTEAAGPTLYVTIVGNGSVTINDIPQGNYIVSQDNTWSWRYSNGAVKLAVIGTNPANYTVTYSAGPTRHNWLHGNSGLLCR